MNTPFLSQKEKKLVQQWLKQKFIKTGNVTLHAAEVHTNLLVQNAFFRENIWR